MKKSVRKVLDSLSPESTVRVFGSETELEVYGCHAGKDGDCIWEGCPQLRDGEPAATGRHCPLDRNRTDD